MCGQENRWGMVGLRFKELSLNKVGVSSTQQFNPWKCASFHETSWKWWLTSELDFNNTKKYHYIYLHHMLQNGKENHIKLKLNKNRSFEGNLLPTRMEVYDWSIIHDYLRNLLRIFSINLSHTTNITTNKPTLSLCTFFSDRKEPTCLGLAGRG